MEAWTHGKAVATGNEYLAGIGGWALGNAIFGEAGHQFAKTFAGARGDITTVNPVDGNPPPKPANDNFPDAGSGRTPHKSDADLKPLVCETADQTRVTDATGAATDKIKPQLWMGNQKSPTCLWHSASRAADWKDRRSLRAII